MTKEGGTIDLSRLEYRPIRDDEFDQLSALYDLAGWGPLSGEILRSWYTGGPLGDSLIMVIADESGELLGTTMYSPYRVRIFDRLEIASRSRSAILVPELRRSARGMPAPDENEPMDFLRREARRYRLERGWRLGYSLPNEMYLKRPPRERAEKRQGVRSRHVFGPGLRIEIAGESPGPQPLLVEPATETGPEYDALWDQARSALGIECAVDRSAESLRIHYYGSLLECRDPATKELVGYVSYQDLEDGKLQDLLAVSREMFGPVVASSLSWLRAHQDDLWMRWINSFPHPVYKDALVEAGAREVDWLFSFNVMSLLDEAGPEVDATRWYVTTGD